MQSSRPATLKELAMQSFGQYAADLCLEMLLAPLISGSIHEVWRRGNNLRRTVRMLPKSLANDVSEEILIGIESIAIDINSCYQLPWFDGVLHMFAHAAFHPQTSIVRFRYHTRYLLQYLVQCLTDRGSLKVLIVDPRNRRRCHRSYLARSDKHAFKEVLKNVILRKDCSRHLLEEFKITNHVIRGKRHQKILHSNTINYEGVLSIFCQKLKGLVTIVCLYQATKFILRHFVLNCEALKMLDLSFSKQVDNSCIPILIIPNLTALSILDTGINHRGTLALLKYLLKRNQYTLRFFLCNGMFLEDIIVGMSNFPFMEDIERSLKLFGEYHPMPLTIEQYFVIESHRRANGEARFKFVQDSLARLELRRELFRKARNGGLRDSGSDSKRGELCKCSKL